MLAAALLHDIGHWPFGHPIEDLGLGQLPDHEELALRDIQSDEVATILRKDWRLEPRDVANLVAGNVETPAQRILSSILSGPIDVDKIDYLMRDSLHAGVPYGQHFDRRRLIGSLCLNEAGDALAITDKGKTAAEMMVFARYVMFSEVYWHHAVRSATAMLQRAFYMLRDHLDIERMVTMTEQPWTDAMVTAGRSSPAGTLLDGIFGPTRSLYKRLAQYSYFEAPEMYQRMAKRPYAELANFSERIAAGLSSALGEKVAPHEVLVDAPPAKLEVDFDIEVYFAKQSVFRRLGDISPVVRTLAKEQFDDYVKRVRIFVHPRITARAQAAKSGRGHFRRRSTPVNSRHSGRCHGMQPLAPRGAGTMLEARRFVCTWRNSASCWDNQLFAQQTTGHEHIGKGPLAIGLDHQEPHQFVARHQAHFDRQVAEPHVRRVALRL